MQYLVTVKLPKNRWHDPQNKLNGSCPVTGKVCTDVTGEHHTLLIEASSLDDAKTQVLAKFKHITRIEET